MTVRSTQALEAAAGRTLRPLIPLSVALALWGLGYAFYRAYYALGGTWLLPGTLANPAEFRFINAAAVVILATAALLPITMLPLWRRPRLRPLLLGVCWLIAVGCCMHAAIDIIARVLSLTRLLQIQYPMTVWASIVPRIADLQDLLFNEPWFLLEGLGFGALAWLVLGPGHQRRRFVGAASVAISALVVLGLLSLTGVIGRWIIG